MQRKYTQLQLLKQQLNNLIEEKQKIAERIQELMQTINVLDELGKAKGDNVWTSVGSACFLDSKLNSKKVRMVVGADVMVDKDISGAKEILNKRLEEANEVDAKITDQINVFSQRMQQVEQELQEAASDAGNKSEENDSGKTTEVAGG
jgi:prefoldin alpha subunit